jgi:large subunit ribosomal protein L15
MIVATVFALATLVYVAVDIILELLSKEKKEKKKKEKYETPLVAVIPNEETATPEIMPVILDHTDAEEADAMISDSLAMKNVCYEGGAGRGRQHIINIGVLNDNFDSDDVITISLLRQRHLISRKAGRMKVLADGILTKPLTIKAESYSIQAIKMIELTGGTVIILKD